MILLFAILLLLIVLLYLPVCIDVKYIGGEFNYKITYAFITLYPKHKKPKRKSVKKSKKSKKVLQDSKAKDVTPKDTSPTKNDGDTKKDVKKSPKEDTKADSDLNALDTLSLALDIFKALKDKLGEFITSVKITNLYINFKVADLDAYDCALRFGKLNVIVGNVLGFLQWNFKVKKKSISIEPKYNSNDSLYDISFKVKLGLGKGLGKILVMLLKVVPILKDNDVI